MAAILSYSRPLVMDVNSYLYAGGDFDMASGTTVSHIARWDGFAWSALGSGTDCNVFELAIPTSGGQPDLAGLLD